MAKYVRILSLLFIPLLCAGGLLELSLHKYDVHLRDMLLQAAEEQHETWDVSDVTFRQFCADEEVGHSFSLCKDVWMMYTAEILAAGMLLLGVLYVGLIGWLGRASRGDRRKLLRFFRPAMYLTGFLAGTVLLVNVVVWLAAAYYIQAVYLEKVYIKLLLLLALAGLIGLYILGNALFHALRKPVADTSDEEMPEEKQGKLWALVRGVADKLGAKTPDHITAGLDVSFYATEVMQRTPEKTLRGETLHISLPLCRILSRAELEFIIGHELTHFAGDDVKYTTRFYPIYASASRALGMLEQQSEEGLCSWLALCPAKELFGFFLSVFSENEAEISRLRELNADLSSQTAVCSAPTAASALVKVHAYAPLFNTVSDWQIEWMQEKKASSNLSKVYEDLARKCPAEEAERNLQEFCETHPTDTHPPLARRLENLSVSPDTAVECGLTLPEEPACACIENLEEIEEKLTQYSNAWAFQVCQMMAQEKK